MVCIKYQIYDAMTSYSSSVKMFDWFAGDGFRCSSALCLFVYVLNFLNLYFQFQTVFFPCEMNETHVRDMNNQANGLGKKRGRGSLY